MRTAIIQALCLVMGGGWCSYIFYQEDMGLNTLFFVIPLLVLAFATTYRTGPYQKEVAVLAVGSFLSALAVVGNDSDLAKSMYWISILVFIGFIKHSSLQFLPLVIAAGISNLISVPLGIIREFTSNRTYINSLNYTLRKAINWLIPLGLFTLFLLIYYLANDKFGAMVDAIISYCFTPTSQGVAIEQVALFSIGFLLFGAILFGNPFKAILSNWQDRLDINLIRNRESRFATYFNPLVLKGRFKLSIITLTLLNALICIVNLTDLIYVWFSRRTLTAWELSTYVHEGTNLLIFAILLAAVLLLVIFRKNLNFFPNNEGLKKLAYIWLGQNIFMVLSVAIRNYQYSHNFGLTYKRIGVFLFLLIVLIGLVTLFIKIRDKKSHYFLWHRNSWAVYLVLLVAGFVNWNLLITRVNLNPNFTKHLDIQYLINDLPNENAFLLDRHGQSLQKQFPIQYSKVKNRIDQKLKRACSGRSIYSWTWPYHLNQKHKKSE
ncbi:MAG: DUF4173 domain-containing protein [Saprospiraceae bacterium]|nr:DUF4173 domain-containing protein [Saprospiraceae bacterium]